MKPSQGDMWIGGSCRLPSSHPMAELSSALSNQQSRPSVLLLCLQDCAASGCMAEALQVVQQQASTQGLRQAFAYLPASTAQVRVLHSLLCAHSAAFVISTASCKPGALLSIDALHPESNAAICHGTAGQHVAG